MVGRSGGGGGGGFDYVQDPEPTDPEEGEQWYDTGDDPGSAYVYDGAGWIEQTIADHSELSGISSSDHHERPNIAMEDKSFVAPADSSRAWNEISFGNTYKNVVYWAAVQGDSDDTFGAWHGGYRTDSEGNITGANIYTTNSSSEGQSTSLLVLGETV